MDKANISLLMAIRVCKALFVVSFLVLCLNLNLPCSAIPLPEEQASTSDSPTLRAIEKLTNDVVAREVNLLKVSTNFHLACLKPSKWKGLRVFAYKIAGSGLTNAGIITIAASRFQYADNPSAAPRPYLKAGHIINLVAASVVTGGTITEGVLDRINDRKLLKQHLDPQSALLKFIDLRNELDTLISRREVLISSCQELTANQREILLADGRILSDIRDLATSEFVNSYCEVARFRGARDMASATTLFGASTAGYMGSLDSLLSVANRRPTQTGVAGLGFITSGTSVVVAPVLTKWAGDTAARRAVDRLSNSEILKQQDVASNFDLHRKSLEDLVASASLSDKQLLTALDARRSIYSAHNEIFDRRHEFRTNAKVRARNELKERLFFSSIVGGTNIARGAQLAVAGFHYSDSPKDAFKLVAAASTVYIAGSGVWTADNIQGKVREELLKKKLSSANLSVHATLAKDLEQLDLMESQINIY